MWKHSINTAFVWLGTAAIRGRRLDQEVKTNEKWLWLIATAIHCKLRMVLHANYVKSSGGSGGGGSPLFLDQTEAWRAEKIFGDSYWKLWRSYWHFTSVYSSLSLWILRRIVTYMYKINHTSVWTIWILQSLWWMSVQQDSRVHNNLITVCCDVSCGNTGLTRNCKAWEKRPREEVDRVIIRAPGLLAHISP